MTVDVEAAELNALRAVADPLRWRILLALAREQLCVCHLVDDLEVAQPLVSHHLRVLRQAGLVTSQRYRYWSYYQLRPEAVEVLGRRLVELAAHAPTGAGGRRPCPVEARGDTEEDPTR